MLLSLHFIPFNPKINFMFLTPSIENWVSSSNVIGAIFKAFYIDEFHWKNGSRLYKHDLKFIKFYVFLKLNLNDLSKAGNYPLVLSHLLFTKLSFEL